MNHEHPSPREVAARLGHWSGGRAPLRRQLTDALRTAIARGELRRGDRMPSDRALARALSLSRTTTLHAYGALKREGLLHSRPGGSTWVAPDVQGAGRPGSARRAAMFRRLLADGPAGSSAARDAAGPDEVIDLTLAALPALPGVEDAVRKAVDHDLPSTLATHGYELAGVPTLRDAIARDFTRRGAPTQPDQVLVTSGTQQALAVIAAALVGHGDGVVVEEVTHPGALTVLRDAGALLRPVPVGMAADRPAELEAALRGVRLAYCIPTHHNPSGSVMSAGRRRRLTRSAATAGVTLVEDGTLDDLTLGVDAPPPLAATPEGATVVSVGSVSKTYWGGLRVGWVRAPQPLVESLLAHKAAADLGSAVLEQHVARRLLDGGDRLRDALQTRRQVLAAQRDTLEEALVKSRSPRELPGWRWTRPVGGLSLWVDVGDADPVTLAGAALRRGVAVAPGPEFAAAAAGDHHLRLSFAAPADLLREGVSRLARAARAVRPVVGRRTT